MKSVFSQQKRVSNANNSNAMISKSKNIFSIFQWVWRIYIKFGILWKKIWLLYDISFWNYRLEKVRLLKCLKRPMSEHLWTVNMLKCPQHCFNLHSSIFVIFFYPSEKNQLEKYDLLVCEILRLFLNILIPDEKYFLLVKSSV